MRKANVVVLADGSNEFVRRSLHGLAYRVVAVTPVPLRKLSGRGLLIVSTHCAVKLLLWRHRCLTTFNMGGQ